ncbi:hypothetical protein MVEN_01698100 [Mycena venus]|uniref:DUF6535 domain-containing protein n=1 Tax=Mycena venus TaxID=2733690 RepID=A0A8H6XNY7_9AGAR|nr:hypothetical protein MVEN_01698100 [Mycena venus]
MVLLDLKSLQSIRPALCLRRPRRMQYQTLHRSESCRSICVLPMHFLVRFENESLPDSRNTEDHVVGAIAEQSESLMAMFERLTAAVEALKQQPPSTDKKMTFWTHYKTLADEFDSDFQRKYGNDLDTSVIFVGLFSAVSSAFIIFIQPEFQLDPNAPTQTLLVLLLQNLKDTGIPPNLMPQLDTAPPCIVVVAQGLLYFSLLSMVTGK